MCEIHDDGRPFDWSQMQDSVVLREQPTTAVYSNVNGHIVIRQEAEVFEDDPYVTIAPENLEAVIHAMREQAEMLAHERECMAARRRREGPPKALPAPENHPATGTVNGPASETVADKSGLFDE